MIDQKLFTKWQKLRKTSRQAIYQRIKKLRASKHFSITVEEAAYMLAAQDGIDIARYLSGDEYDRVRQLLGTSIVNTRQDRIEPAEREEIGVISSISKPIVRRIRQLRTDLSDQTIKGISAALRKLRSGLSDAYSQALEDLEDRKRKSYRGVANELREVLREVIDTLGPDSKVKGQSWFQLEPGQTKPTRKQKLRYVFQSQNDGIESETTVAGLDTVEEKLTKLILALYSRSNRASHSSRDRDELRKIVSYVNPVLVDLLATSKKRHRK